MLNNNDLTLRYLSEEFEINLDDLIKKSNDLKIFGKGITNLDMPYPISEKEAKSLVLALKPEEYTKFVLLRQSKSGI